MFIIWFLMYYTSLINLELNLQAGKGLALGRLGRYFSGRIAEIIGMVNLKILSYALLAVFIWRFVNNTKLIILRYKYNLYRSMVCCYIYFSIIAPLKLIDYINRLLFIGILIVIAILIIGLIAMIKWYNLPLFLSRYKEILVWSEIIPVVFTSFGFQVIYSYLSNWCRCRSM